LGGLLNLAYKFPSTLNFIGNVVTLLSSSSEFELFLYWRVILFLCGPRTTLSSPRFLPNVFQRIPEFAMTGININLYSVAGILWTLRNGWISIQTFISFIHSIGLCRIRRFLAVLRSFFHYSLWCNFSCHPSPPTNLPSSLTSSCHLFLGLPLNLDVPKSIYNTLLGILFSSILCTCNYTNMQYQNTFGS